MEELWIQWGENVKRERTSAGLSVRQLALAAGTHPSQISRIERGLRGVSDPLKNRIADALNADPAEMFPLRPGIAA